MQRVFLVAVAILVAPSLVFAQDGTQGAVGVPVPENGRLSPFATEGTPRRVTNGVSLSDLTRMAPGLEYRVLPGDIYVFDIYHYAGSSSGVEHLTVQVLLEDDYTLQVPLVGPISGRGLLFSELRKQAMSKLRATVRLQHADMWMASPALFTVFVTGAVTQPGGIVVNGLTRVSGAIDQAGGALAGASWRRIVHRGGHGEGTVDLLRWADGSSEAANPMLRPGDSIDVPFTRTGARVTGRVRYPGLYELLEGETLSDLLRFAGGAISGSDLMSVRVTRVTDTGEYSIVEVDASANPTYPVSDGDIVSVPSLVENAPMILVEGALFGSAQDAASPAAVPAAPITVQLPHTEGTTLLDVLERLGGLTPWAEGRGGYITRATGARVDVDMASLWETRSIAADVPLMPGDRVVVPMVPLNVVVLGEVYNPGAQAYAPGRTVGDYIRAAGGAVDGRGTLAALTLRTREGNVRPASLTEVAKPGETVTVGKKFGAAVSDFFGSNVFTVTGVALTFIAIATSVIEFLQLVGVQIP